MQNWLRESDLMVSFNKSEGLIWTKWFIKLMIGKMRYDVTVSKSQNLDTASRPCYDGDDYTDQEYLRLGEIIKEKFQCTSPFVPKHLRQGLTICKDQRMGKKVWNFTQSNLAFMNFWINILDLHWCWISWIDFFIWLVIRLDWLWLLSDDWWCLLDWNCF